MTLTNMLEVGLFLGEMVTTVVNYAMAAFAEDRTVTIDEIDKATEAAFNRWSRAKDKHWSIVNDLADDREEKMREADASDPE